MFVPRRCVGWFLEVIAGRCALRAPGRHLCRAVRDSLSFEQLSQESACRQWPRTRCAAVSRETGLMDCLCVPKRHKDSSSKKTPGTQRSTHVSIGMKASSLQSLPGRTHCWLSTVSSPKMNFIFQFPSKAQINRRTH